MTVCNMSRLSRPSYEASYVSWENYILEASIGIIHILLANGTCKKKKKNRRVPVGRYNIIHGLQISKSLNLYMSFDITFSLSPSPKPIQFRGVR